MGWDKYIESVIGGAKGSCDKVCIIGLDGGIWTSDDHASAIKITREEAANIRSVLNQSGSEKFNTFHSNGIVVESIKYQFLREIEEEIVYGKKKNEGAITLHSTNKAVIITHTKEGEQHGATNTAVEHIAKTMTNLGY